MTNFESLRVRDSATIEMDNPALIEQVGLVNDHLNTHGTQKFLDTAAKASDFNEMAYGIVQNKESSRNATILMPAPFGNGVWPHLIARAEAVRHLAEVNGLRSSEGEPFSVTLTGAPSKLSRFGLTPEEIAKVSSGDFDSIASKHGELFDKEQITEIGGYIGYSQAAAFGESIYHILGANMDFNGAIQIQESPCTSVRSVASLALKMVVEGTRFNKTLAMGEIDVIDELFETKKAVDEVEKGVIKERKENMAIARGFSSGKLDVQIEELLRGGADVFVLDALSSVLTDSERTAKVVEDARQMGALGTLRHATIVGDGANHAFGDLVGHFAAVSVANL